MEHKKLKTIPSKVEEVIEKITCDICKSEIVRYKGCSIYDVEIYARHSNGTEDGGYSKEYKFDICWKCFNEKIIPFIKSFGCEPKETDGEW